MKVSIVIPVYNEAGHLGACLEAIARQTHKPHEVIVVDNNSTDGSREVASSFAFVQLLTESKQGVVHARTTGFDAVSGDIIARLDADSIIADDWVAKVSAVFDDKSIDAVSGIALYYNVAAAPLFNAIDLFFRRRLERQLRDRLYLWGANMAIRRESWQLASHALCQHGGLHEDYDLAIHLQELGGSVIFDERLRAQVSSRRINVSYLSFMRYVLRSPGTYAAHRIKRRIHMYEVVLVCAIGYLPARILHRGYDPLAKRFKWSRVLISGGSLARPDPTANVA